PVVRRAPGRSARRDPDPPRRQRASALLAPRRRDLANRAQRRRRRPVRRPPAERPDRRLDRRAQEPPQHDLLVPRPDRPRPLPARERPAVLLRADRAPGAGAPRPADGGDAPPLTLVLLALGPLGLPPPGKSVIGAYAKELAPFLALSLASGILTLVAQRSVQAMQTLQSYPWSFRLGNAVVSYAWYLKVVVWPSGLAAFYPHPMETLPVGVIVVAAVALAALIALVYLGPSIPGVVMGCVWYVGTMLPVAGFIQVGSQAYADRYAYIPLI